MHSEYYNRASFAVLTTVIFILCLCGRGPVYQMQGEVHRQVKNDTLLIAYDLLVPQAYCDSVVFQLPLDSGFGAARQCPPQAPESVLYRATNAFGLDQKDDTSASPVRLAGKLAFPHPKCYDTNRYGLHLYYDLVDPETRKPEAHDSYPDLFRFHPTGNFGRSSETGIAQVDQYGYPIKVRNKNKPYVFHLMDKLGYCREQWTEYLSYRINHSGPFTYNDYAIIGGDYYPGGRESLWPSFIIAAKYSRARTGKKANEFVREGLGTETGIRFDRRFESLAYTYSSNLGGVHRFDLSFALFASQGESIGTRYTVYHGKYFTMYQISAYIDLWSPNERSIARIHNRPVIHTIVAAVALLPFLPAALCD